MLVVIVSVYVHGSLNVSKMALKMRKLVMCSNFVAMKKSENEGNGERKWKLLNMDAKSSDEAMNP